MKNSLSLASMRYAARHTTIKLLHVPTVYYLVFATNFYNYSPSFMDCKSISPNLIRLTLLLSCTILCGNIFPRQEKKDGLRDPNDDMRPPNCIQSQTRTDQIRRDNKESWPTLLLKKTQSAPAYKCIEGRKNKTKKPLKIECRVQWVCPI